MGNRSFSGVMHIQIATAKELIWINLNVETLNYESYPVLFFLNFSNYCLQHV